MTDEETIVWFEADTARLHRMRDTVEKLRIISSDAEAEFEELYRWFTAELDDILRRAERVTR